MLLLLHVNKILTYKASSGIQLGRLMEHVINKKHIQAYYINRAATNSHPLAIQVIASSP